MDCVTSLLNEYIDGDNYMDLAAVFKDPTLPNIVWKLKKALYGLKKAPRQWYAKTNEFLLE